MPVSLGAETTKEEMKINSTLQKSGLKSVQRVETNQRKDYQHDGYNEQQAKVTSLCVTEKINESIISILEIGSRVANNNPDKMSYNWHGKIVGFDRDGANVSWDERKGMKGGQVLWHRLSELRLLEKQ